MARHHAVHADNLPQPRCRYSQPWHSSACVFVSGQGATDPETGHICRGEHRDADRACLKNVEAILTAGGSNLQCVLRCGVFLVDMSEFQRMNAVYARAFGEHRPARTTIQAAALPVEGLRVEIDCIAYVP